MRRILLLGVNGFIGHHLSQRIIAATDWEIYGMDMQTDRITDLLPEKRFHFFEGDITINREWIEYHIKKCDTVLPLVAIATPATYVREPLRVFELDFEANLPIVRACVRYRKRVVFPSTSEVYGMCRGEAIKLVDGGTQKRTFTYIDDGIDALIKIIANDAGVASGKIYNVGNPKNNFSVRELARMMLDLALTYPEYKDSAARVELIETTADAYYGKGYQDVQNRVPNIDNTCAELGWQPMVAMEESLRRIFDAYRGQVAEARALVE